jgi:Piwi domain
LLLLLVMDFILSAFYLKFDILKNGTVNDNPRGPGYLAITIDIKAKIVRKDSLLVTLNKQRGIQEGGDYTREWTREEIKAAQNYTGSVVLYSRDRKTYTVIQLDFDHTWDTLMIPGTDQSHSQYFANKGIKLAHPGCKPILVVRGRRGSEIYFPPELASLNELPPEDRDRLPQIASFLPNVRNQAVDNLVAFLKKREADDDSNLLLAAGFRLGDRKTVAGHVLPPPDIEAAVTGGKVAKEKLEFFPGILKGANYKVNGNDCTELSGVVFYNSDSSISDPRNSALNVYSRIARWVLELKAKYRLSPEPLFMFDTGGGEREPHLNAVADFLREEEKNKVNLNLFILDFCKPLKKAKTDPAYHPVKQVLMKGGYVSQFVNYNSANHFRAGDKTSGVVLVSVARQILCKAGVRLYWSHIPPELPTPVMFVGIDITHAPFEFSQASQRQTRASSYAAVVTDTRLGAGIHADIISHSKVSRRNPGEEFNLRDLDTRCVMQ